MSLTSSKFTCISAIAAVSMAFANSPAQAQAAASALKIEFLTPNDTVSPTDVIPVQMRLTNTDSAQAFTVSSSTGVLGMPSSALPQTAWWWDPAQNDYVEVAFASYSGFALGMGYRCDSTFTSPGCGIGPYAFTFGGIEYSDQFQLAAGGSIEYEYGHFTPFPGPAPVGSYTLYNAPLMLVVYGSAQDGRSLTGLVTLANSCSSLPADCVATGQVFTRTVQAVPEPGQLTLMALGLLALTARQLRRRS